MSFRLAVPGQGAMMTPAIEKPMSVPATYAENEGALLIDDGNGNWAVCGPNPPLIGAVAVTPGGNDTTSLAGVGAFNIRGRKEFPTGVMQAIFAGDSQTFLAKFVGTPPTSGRGMFGVIRDTDGFWKINFNDTVNQRVLVTSLQTPTPEAQPYALCQFLAAFTQLN